MATLYIRTGATGTNTGADWTNAFPNIPANLVRGNIYYIARGDGASYGDYFFDDAESTNVLITLRVATIADHGTETGWNNAFAGQVILGNCLCNRDYYHLDGNGRNEADWDDFDAYGFLVSGALVSHNDTFAPGGDHWIIENMDIGGDESEIYVAGIPNDAMELVNISGSAKVNDWQILGCRFHNARVGLTLLAAENISIYDCMFANTFDKEAIIGLGSANNIRVRRCRFRNTCQDNPDDPEANGATAIIGAWGNGSSAGDWDNWEIGNCEFWNTIEIHHSDAVIIIGGDGVTWLGAGTTGTKVYNNSFKGIISGVTNIQINGVGNDCHNNLAYNMDGTFTPNCDNESNNSLELVDPYVDSANADFRLSAALPGATLGAGYDDIDIRGVERTNPWDIGANEFEGGGGGGETTGGRGSLVINSPLCCLRL